MSVNRKVTTPEGLGTTPTWCHDWLAANRLSTGHLRKASLHHSQVLVDRVLQLVHMRLRLRRLNVRPRLNRVQRDLLDLFGLDIAAEFRSLLLAGAAGLLVLLLALPLHRSGGLAVLLLLLRDVLTRQRHSGGAHIDAGC